MHVPSHLVSQQTPSVQKPLAHCESQPQRSPLALDAESDPVHAGSVEPSVSADASGASMTPPSRPPEPPAPPFEPPAPECIEPDPQPTTSPKAHAKVVNRKKPHPTFTSSNPTRFDCMDVPPETRSK
jgi:hypothetical protein